MAWRVLEGDCRERLRELPTGSVHCVVTSPPYWGLRVYGGWRMQLMWGEGDRFTVSRRHPERWWTRIRWRASQRSGGVFVPDSSIWIGALGLEPTPEMYVDHLVEIFREVRRVLRDDGVVWLNLGDSYAGSWGNYGARSGKQRTRVSERWHRRAYEDPRHGWTGLPPTASVISLKRKNLCGIPWRVALSLQAHGWYLRSDVIWAKPNPLPESVRDRPTRSHEYVFLLIKSDRYFYDAEAVKEPLARPEELTREVPFVFGGRRKYRGYGTRLHSGNEYRGVLTGRNRRTVWTIATQPFPEGHFATMPPRLAEICILAGTSAFGCCPRCGAPYRRMVEKKEPDHEWQHLCGADASGGYRGKARKDYASAKAQDPSAVKARVLAGMRKTFTVGWRPTCSCDAGPPRPCVVLDPFAGAGTTLYVAERLGRDSIGIELNPDYVEITKRRMATVRHVQHQLLF